MYINKSSPVPVYHQLRNIIFEKISRGEFRPGDAIPSERVLGETYKISRMTVRQAVNMLVQEGVLYRERGKGTFVSRSKLEQRNIMSFSEMVRARGMTPSTKVLEFETINAKEDLVKLLQLDKQEEVFRVKRLRRADGMPVGIEEVFLPERYCPGLEKQQLTGSLYNLIRKEYNYRIYYVDNKIEAGYASERDRQLLKIEGHVPVLRITALYYMEGPQRMFYERSIYRADEYKYSIRIFVNNAQISDNS